MKKIYFIAGFLSLSAFVISCSNDDNFKDEVQSKQQQNIQETFTIKEVKQIEGDQDPVNRGDDDLDKDKSKGPIKGKGKGK